MRIEHCEHQSIRIWIDLCLPAFKHLCAGERQSISKRRKENLLIVCDIIPHKNVSDELLGCLHSTMHEVYADTINNVLFEPNLLLRIIGVGSNSFSTDLLCDVDPLFISWAILPEDADLNIRIAVCPAARCRTAKEYSTHIRQSCIGWSKTLCKSKTPSARLRHSSSFIFYHMVNNRPTACVCAALCKSTRWWAGGENAVLTEPTSSHTNRLKTRRLPPPHLHCIERSAVQVWPRCSSGDRVHAVLGAFYFRSSLLSFVQHDVFRTYCVETRRGMYLLFDSLQ